MTRFRRPLAVSVLVALMAFVAAVPQPCGRLAVDPIRIGAVFPLSGSAAGLAGDELRGVQIAVDLANADGGVRGRSIQLEVRDLPRAADAPTVMASLRADGIEAVIGAYGSHLSIAASQAAAAVGLV